MDKRFLVIMAIIVTAFIGLFVFSGSGQEDGDSAGSTSNHTKGGNSKGVELVVFKDFQCGPCALFTTIDSQVFDKYQDEISFTFKHYPIPTGSNSVAAHRAAESAGVQGKFWEMYEILFSRQQQWGESQSAKSIFETYAQELNLDLAKFDEDFVAEATNSTINADKQEGSNLGVTGTPTYFLNGQALEGEEIQTVEGFSQKIDEAIAASENQ
jgi:protein-disulfide isomerase